MRDPLLAVARFQQIPTASEPAVAVLAAKRLFDVLGAGIALVLLSPLLMLTAVGVKVTSAGPMFFRQWRLGKDGRLFSIYKFRTMRIEACDVSGVQQTMPSDDRVTSFGRLLRRASLDELPQLLNVLKGDMSLVGPRPHVPWMMACGVPYEDLVPHYALRHRVKPGITGLAQVRGYRGPTTNLHMSVRRVQSDIEYIDKLSVFYDVWIVIKTVAVEVVQQRGL